MFNVGQNPVTVQTAVTQSFWPVSVIGKWKANDLKEKQHINFEFVYM